MQDLGQALQETILTITASLSDEHVCPHCHQVVPKMTIHVFGMEKTVQPRCRCEVLEFERGVTEAVERKEKNEIERKFSLDNLGERFQNCRFDTFILKEGNRKAAEMARGYALNFGDYGGESLLIWGKPGNGKSHLAAAVCHEIRAKGFIPVFQTMPELLERIRNTFNKKSHESEREIMDALRECDLLVLDDIGAEKVTDWVLDVLFRIIDGRYRNKKPTMFTTNFSPTDLLYRFMPERPTAEQEIAAKRIHDRILEVSIIVENKAPSHRLETAAARAKEADIRRMWA